MMLRRFGTFPLFALFLGVLAAAGAQVARAQSIGAPMRAGKDINNTTPVPMPAFKFDIVSFRRCSDDSGPASSRPQNGGDFITFHCQTIGGLIYYAYLSAEHPFQMSGEPGWVDSDRYEFTGKVAPEDIPAFQKLDLAGRRMLMRGTLADVLKLQLHPDATPRPVYDLEVGKGGPKLAPYTPDEENTLPSGRKLQGIDSAFFADGTARYQGISMPQFADAISARVGRPVIDKTNLPGRYDLTTYMPPAHYSPNMEGDAGDSPIPRIFDGVKALGLELVSSKGFTGAIIIDHIDRPPEN